MPVFEFDNWAIKHRDQSRRVAEHIERLQEEHSDADDEALGWKLLDYVVLEATVDGEPVDEPSLDMPLKVLAKFMTYWFDNADDDSAEIRKLAKRAGK